MTRGMSLLEVMVAMGISVTVLAGAMVAGTALQRRSALERDVNEVQSLGRAVRDQMTSDLVLTGSGMGAARIYIGGNSGKVDPKTGAALPPVRYAVNVLSNITGPSDAGAIGRSDLVDLFSSDGDVLVLGGGCGGCDVRTTGCKSVIAGPPAKFCTGSNVPVGTQGLLAGQQVFISSPAMGVACLATIPAVGAFAVPGQIIFRLGMNPIGVDDPPPFGEMCDPAHPVFWDMSKNPGIMMTRARSVAYRVNWRAIDAGNPDAGNVELPVLEYDNDGLIGPNTFQDLSYDVEQLKVRYGVTQSLGDAGAGLEWIGEYGGGADGGAPGLDTWSDSAMVTTMNTKLGGFQGDDDAGFYAANDGPRFAMMRRIRAIEVTLMLRSRRDDIQVKPGTSTVDEAGHPIDGHRRRVVTFSVSPRSFAYGAKP